MFYYRPLLKPDIVSNDQYFVACLYQNRYFYITQQKKVSFTSDATKKTLVLPQRKNNVSFTAEKKTSFVLLQRKKNVSFTAEKKKCCFYIRYLYITKQKNIVSFTAEKKKTLVLLQRKKNVGFTAEKKNIGFTAEK